MVRWVWDVEFKFEPRDIWIGLFWNISERKDFYICLLPMCLIHVMAWKVNK